MKGLGFGCFYFGTKLTKGQKLNTQDHVDEIENVLKKIPSIDDIEIKHIKKINEEILIDESKDNKIFPKINFLRISFSLSIPKRIMKEYSAESLTLWQVEAEKFHVQIYDTFFGPISIVEPLDVEHESKPSCCLELVSKFLSSELSKIDTNITLETVSPSPFTADIYIGKGGEQQTKQVFEKIEHQRIGFDVIEFLYRGDLFKDDNEALKYLIREMGNEIGLYYKISKTTMSVNKSWEDIERKRIEIENLESEPRLSKTSSWSLNKKRRELIKLLYKLEAREESARSIINKDIATVEKSQETTYFRGDLLHKELEFPHHPIRPIRDWLVHGESNTMKHVELWAIGISTIVGGIAGGVVSLLLSG